MLCSMPALRGEGGGLAGFEEVADGWLRWVSCGFCCQVFDDGAGVVAAVVVDDGDGDVEAGGDGGAQEAEDGEAEEAAAVVGGDDDVEGGHGGLDGGKGLGVAAGVGADADGDGCGGAAVGGKGAGAADPAIPEAGDDGVACGLVAAEQGEVAEVELVSPPEGFGEGEAAGVLAPETGFVACHVVPVVGLDVVGGEGGVFFVVEDDGAEVDGVAEAGVGGAKGEVGVFPVGEEAVVEGADAADEVGADEERGAHEEDVGGVGAGPLAGAAEVVGGLEGGDFRAEEAAEVEVLFGVLERGDAGGDEADAGVCLGDADERGEGTAVGKGVVVEKPDEVVAVLEGVAEAEVGAAGEAGVGWELDELDAGGDERAEVPGGAVRGAVVDQENREVGVGHAQDGVEAGDGLMGGVPVEQDDEDAGGELRRGWT